MEGAVRPFYSQLRPPVSSLSIGEYGWIQSSIFIVTGLLTIAFATGMRSSLAQEASKWAPIFTAVTGVGLIGAGLFVTDPMNGYLLGTPLIPMQFTITGRLHRLFSAFFFLGLPLVTFNLVRWFARWKNTPWSLYSVTSGITFLATFVIASAALLQAGALAELAGLFQRLAITTGWLWITLFAIHLTRRRAA